MGVYIGLHVGPRRLLGGPCLTRKAVTTSPQSVTQEALRGELTRRRVLVGYLLETADLVGKAFCFLLVCQRAPLLIMSLREVVHTKRQK